MERYVVDVHGFRKFSAVPYEGFPKRVRSETVACASSDSQNRVLSCVKFGLC